MDSFRPKIIPLAVEPENYPGGGIVFVSQIKSKIQFKLGTVFALMEFFDLPEDFISGLEEIISDLKTEYYLPPLEAELGVEKRLEECLQRANRRLGKLIESRAEDIELENINVLVGLFHRQRIYLSEIGKINAFLFHRSKNEHYAIINIFEQATNKRRQKAELEKMFSNIISGEISEKDHLFFCNDNVLAYLSQNEILEITKKLDAIDGVKKIKDILLEQEEGGSFYLVAVKTDNQDVEPITTYRQNRQNEIIKEKRIVLDTPQESLEKLVGTQKKTERYLTPSLMPNWQKIIILALIGLKKSLKQILKWTAAGIISSGAVLKHTVTKRLKPSTSVRGDDILSAEKNNETEEKEKTKKEKETTAIEKTTALESRKKIALFRRHFVFDIFSTWLNRGLAAFSALNIWQKTVLIAAAVLILAFSQSIVIIGQKNGGIDNQALNAQIDRVRELIGAAEARNIFNDEASAKQQLAEAQKLLSALSWTKKTESIRSDLVAQAEKLNRILQKITALDQLNVVVDLEQYNAEFDGIGLAGFGQNLFTFDNNSHHLHQINTRTGQVTTWPLNREIKNIKDIHALDDKSILLLNENNEFYLYHLTDNTMEKVLVSNFSISDFDVYNGKIYALASTENQIYKHDAVSTGFSQGVKWLKDGSNLTDSKVMAIDGGIFILSDDSHLSYFLKGKKIDDHTLDVAPIIAGPSSMAADVSADYLYLTEPAQKRLVILRKNGVLIAQYVHEEFSNLKSIFADEKTGGPYLLLADGKIIKIDRSF